MNNKEKKPVYKKVWFWIIIVVVIGAIGAGSSQNGAKVVNSNNANQPSKSQQAEKTEFKVGETIAFDGKEVVIKTLQRNWTSDNQFIKPSEGKEFIKAVVTIVNKSNGELSFNKFDWKAEDANGAIEGPSLGAAAGDDLGSGDLAVNGKKEGSVIFEAPTGSSIKIHYQPSFWSNKKIIIAP